MIVTNLNNQIAQALKARDSLRLSTLRLLSSAFNYERINLGHELNEAEELSVVRREAKKRKDSIEAYHNAGREELAQKEREELKILEEYLPAGLSDEELEKLVDKGIKELGINDLKDMGRVIGFVVKASGGTAEGGKVSEIVKAKLQK